MIRLEFVVWQFVRLMVALEPARGRRGRVRSRGVYGAWQAAWRELDAELTRLGASDAAAFSDLMMGQVVIVEARDAAQLAEVVAALERVIAQLDAEAKAAARDRPRADELRFEAAELRTLRRRLVRRRKRELRAAG